MLEVTNISFGYKFNDSINRVLEDACLNLPKNELNVLLGSSGSGKSTFGKIAAGLVEPDAGSVLVDGIQYASGDWNKVAYVFQNAECQLFMENVYSEIISAPLSQGISVSQAQVLANELIEQFNLNKIARNKINTLSGGEKQKVAIASMLAMRPDYLILDEPTAMMDDASVDLLLNILSGIRSQKQMAILLITQRPRLARYADNCYLMENGRLSQLDKVEV